MDNMVMCGVGAHDHIADVLGIDRDLHAKSIFNRTH